MKTTLFSFLLVAASQCFVFGADEAPVPPEMAAALANARAYEEAYAKGDAAALAAFFTEDAAYTSDDGREFSGRAAIEAVLSEAFRLNKGSKLAIDVRSATPITPDVIVEKGSSTVTSKNGDAAQGLYTAIQLKQDGKWKISQLIETPLPEITASDRLAELAWLIGEWEEADKESGLTIHSNYRWARGGAYISRNVSVKRGEDPILEGWQIIGWDPVTDSIRSWTFDDAGGYSEGQWTREGQRWLLREAGYAADGSRTTADNTITKVSADRMTWASANRTMDGDPQPAISRIEIRRVKGGE
jgi:uncharacterized protein (TIGR02246 family)